MSEPVHVWYFAYGSNMQSATFRGRRGIEWRRALAVRAPGWTLTLDKPSMFATGSSFANIVPDASGHVLGVAYEITMAELEHVELTEGVAIGNYARQRIRVTPLAGEDELPEAYTLVSGARAPERRPSTRYMALLVAGAEEHGLPAEYVDWLRGLPAQEESLAEKALRAGLDAALRVVRPPKKEPR